MVQGGNVIEARELLREIVVIVRYNPTRICSLQGSSLRNFRYLGLEAVAGGRYELYSAYPIRVPVVLASVTATR